MDNKESYTPLERTESKLVLQCLFKKLAYSSTPSIIVVIFSVALLIFLGVWIPGIQFLPFVFIPTLVVLEALLLMYLDGEWQMTTVINKGTGVISIESFRRSKKGGKVKGTMQCKQFHLENDMNISIQYQRYLMVRDLKQIPVHSIKMTKRGWPIDLFIGENLDSIVVLKRSVERFLHGGVAWDLQNTTDSTPSYSVIRRRNGKLWIGCTSSLIGTIVLMIWLTELETSVSNLYLSLLVIALVLATIGAVIYIIILERKPIVRELNNGD